MTSSVLYFSPTHTCKKAAEAVYNALSAYGACTLYSATLPEEREMLPPHTASGSSSAENGIISDSIRRNRES